MKVIVPNGPNGQPGIQLSPPKHESTRVSDLFFASLTDVSASSVDSSSIYDYFVLPKEHLKVQSNDQMNVTDNSSQRHSNNLFTMSNMTSDASFSLPIRKKTKQSNGASEVASEVTERQQETNDVFLNTADTTTATSEVADSDCFADASSTSILKSPIRKKSNKQNSKGKGKSSHKLKRLLPTDKAADRTLKNPMKNILLGNPSISSVTTNQKANFNLFLYSENKLRKLTIAPRGVCKAGFIRWHCSDRRCFGKVKTSLDNGFIEAYRKIDKNGTESKRFDFRLKEDKCLHKTDLEIFEATLHTCIPVDTKLEVKEKISEKAKTLCEQIEPDTIRRPTRSEIVSKAVKFVLDEYRKNKIIIDPVALKRTCLPRAISRKLLKVLPLLPEITFENRDTYDFAPEFSTGYYPIDLDYANKTKNKTIIFFNSEILAKLTTGQSSLLADSTFPLKRKSIYSQLWILLKTDNTSTEIVCACWMSDQKKDTYLDIINRLEVLCGKSFWVKSIITDGEIGQCNALYEKIRHSDENKCAFHGTQTILRSFKQNGIGKFLPNKNKKITGPVATLCTHVWHVCQLFPYFPVDVTLAMIDYLICHSLKALDDIDPLTQVNLETVLMKTRRMFENDHTYSWYNILTRHITPTWSDVTSNKLERLNGQLKSWLNNNARSRRVSERMKSTQDWLNSYYESNMIFSNEPCRKPSKKTRERRTDILEMLKEIQKSLNKTDYETLVKIDNQIYDMHCMFNQPDHDSDDETWSDDTWSDSESENESEAELTQSLESELA